ncbi:TonB-dependent receptor [Microbacter margulisiae]|uniref:Iron complex outermembrane receptor protein n=1 Tax=Microbacter margulisiae TaxID=1350067 RepID=A0A7W5H1N8_9PORP|nr:TonB-dependent receptor [Microbacter margulisiae]MBB3186576.1 iron complex outermembrane receptor protein [Microbacter margulisiae]
MINRFVFLLVFLSCTAIIFASQSVKNLRDTVNLNEVVITGSPVQINKNNVPLSVSVVNHSQLAASNGSALLPVLNGLVPGLFVTERGVTGFGVSTGSAGQISIRGVGGNPTTGVLMLIDGHPQFMGLFGHPLADSYVASDAQKVEVIRGPASVLYGSNAIGGVINIITREQKQDGFHGDANVMVGSYNTQKYMASSGYKWKKWHIFASVNHDQTAGNRPHSAFSIYNGYFKAGYDMNTHWKSTFDISLAHFVASDPGPDTVNAVPGAQINILRGYWAFAMTNHYDHFSGSINVFNNFGTHHISDGFYSRDATGGVMLSETAHLFEGNRITLGADWLHYGGKAETITPNFTIPFIDTLSNEVAAYGFVQQTVAHQLTLSAGLRLDKSSFESLQWIPYAGFAWRLAPRTTWKADVSKGFRNPTLQELFMWSHNPHLSTERVMSYETSMGQSLFDDHLHMELTGYILRGRNMIITVPLQGLENAGDILNKGIELTAHAALSNNLAAIVTYSYIHMAQPVYATPRHHIYAGLQYHKDRWNVTANFQYINHLNVEPTNTPYFQSYALVNASASYKIANPVELFVNGENLLNTRYQTNHYYPMPGITAFGGVKIHF